MTTHDPESVPRIVKGRTIVLGLLIFGLLMSGSLYVFQTINTYHFADTQNALAKEFPHSRPRVEGGRIKGKQQNPLTFRVTMAVPFNPHEKNEEIEQMADRILEIASKNLQLDNYEQAELHFYQAVPEQQIIMRDVTCDVKNWIKNH